MLPPMALLELRNVGLRFGGIVALDDVSMDVEAGKICGLIGPNGAGKTTAFNVITRLYQPDVGSVTFDGRPLLRTQTHNVIRRGISRTFQNNELFANMSVLDNVLIGAHATSRFRRESQTLAAAREALALVGIERYERRFVTGLAFGARKQVELARALACKPRMLLLDEPAGGLNHEEVASLGAFIQRLRDERNLTVLLVEHHMNLVMRISDYVHVLNFGRLLASGTPDQIQRNPHVVEAYLGGEIDESETAAEAAEHAAELAQAQEEGRPL
jgi:branched-chain amino acid transport system ATP-binding protein